MIFSDLTFKVNNNRIKLNTKMIQIASDLHLEQFFAAEIKANIVPSYVDFCNVMISKNILKAGLNNPTLILAGDICRLVDSYALCKLLLTYCSQNWKRVIWICGNHEFYTSQKKTMDEIIYLAKYLTSKFNNVTFLDNSTTIVENTVIWGGTMWSYLPQNIQLNLPIYVQSNINSNPHSRLAGERSSRAFGTGASRSCDFVQQLTTSDYNDLFYKALQSLNEAIKEAESLKLELIVVSHHAPMFDHMSDDWKINPHRFLYATDLLPQIPNEKIKMWICGHTHVNVDSEFSNVRVICNSDPNKSDYKSCLTINMNDILRDEISKSQEGLAPARLKVDDQTILQFVPSPQQVSV